MSSPEPCRLLPETIGTRSAHPLEKLLYFNGKTMGKHDDSAETIG